MLAKAGKAVNKKFDVGATWLETRTRLMVCNKTERKEILKKLGYPQTTPALNALERKSKFEMCKEIQWAMVLMAAN